MILTFTVPGKPQGKQRPRVVSGRAYTPNETVMFERSVGFCALAERPRGWPLDATYRVTIAARYADKRLRDLDNLIKSVLDGLNGVAWKDDSQVIVITAAKETGQHVAETEVSVEVLP